ncbi:MAG: hypothetical protein QOD47_465 [Gemmatimonadaceae bacterium]|jgi:hypothetical protein|nr:hypothetical protein [Gemmatimonadaceae bacterium]
MVDEPDEEPIRSIRCFSEASVLNFRLGGQTERFNSGTQLIDKQFTKYAESSG